MSVLWWTRSQGMFNNVGAQVALGDNLSDPENPRISLRPQRIGGFLRLAS
jgi:hypothetical protein